jgi:hypothetical protein
VTLLKELAADTTLVLKWEEAKEAEEGFVFFEKPSNQIFSKVDPNTILDYTHQENLMVDFDRDRLTYHMISTEGPKAILGDVNGDGMEDVFIGGAKGFAGDLFIQNANGNFRPSNQKVFENDKFSEDRNGVFFDANGDGSLDLVVASGGNESGFGSPDLADRLYLNDGKGNFSKSESSGLQFLTNSTSVIRTIDINGDGALDLFTGSRLVPFVYGVNPNSSILINDGKGNFTDGTAQYAPQLKELGMVTDAAVVDYDGDGKMDLVVVGEWMAPTFFRNTGNKLEMIEMPEMNAYKGWYQAIVVGDFNNDGKLDFALANHGLNTRFKASEESPIKMYVNDFDQNGSVEHVYVKKQGEKHVPFTLKHQLEGQLPSLKKRYLKYSSFNNQSLEDIFTPEQLSAAVIKEVNFLSSAILVNQGNGKFEMKALLRFAQRSWMYTVLVADINADGNQDLIMGGNLRGAKPEVGQYDGSYGEVLIGKGDGTFDYWQNRDHGLKLDGEIRDLKILELKGKKVLMVVKNNEAVEFWKVEK